VTRPAISVQLYSVRDQLASDRDGTLARISEIGFTAVEPFGLPGQGSGLKEALAKASLKAPTAHGSVVADLDNALAMASDLGTELLIEPWQPEGHFRSADAVATLAKQLAFATDKAKQSGIRIGYHNHAHELTNEIDGKPALLALAELSSPDLVFEVDLFWCQVAGIDIAALLATLGDRVVALHAKDAPLGGETKDQLPLGQGDVPLMSSIASNTNARVIVEFDEYAGDIFDGIEASLRFLKQNGI
jgi:sugar phosphate isomerase/epimerase